MFFVEPSHPKFFIKVSVFRNCYTVIYSKRRLLAPTCVRAMSTSGCVHGGRAVCFICTELHIKFFLKCFTTCTGYHFFTFSAYALTLFFGLFFYLLPMHMYYYATYSMYYAKYYWYYACIFL